MERLCQTRAVAILVSGLILLLLLGLAVIAYATSRSAVCDRNIAQCDAQMNQLSTIQVAVQEMQRWAKECALSREPSVASKYARWKAVLEKTYAAVRPAAIDNPSDIGSIAVLKNQITKEVVLDDQLAAMPPAVAATTKTFQLANNGVESIEDRAERLDASLAKTEAQQSAAESALTSFIRMGVLVLIPLGIAGITAQLVGARRNNRLLAELNGQLENSLVQMRQARDEALEASEYKSKFVAGVSHELRTPLSGMIASIDLLSATSLNEEQLSLLIPLQEAASSLLAILNDILSLSKLEATKITLLRLPFDLKSLINDTAHLMQTAAQGKGLALHCTVANDVPVFIEGDQERLRQILLNLVDNAIKYTDQGAVAIAVSCVSCHEHVSTIRFDVTDSGIGISEEDCKKLFTPFLQLGGPATHRCGTGLGLAICSQLAQLMGGNISVKSAAGKGSTFSLMAPFKVHSGPLPHAQDAGENRPLPTRDGERWRILVVEDDRVLQTLLVRQLEKMSIISTAVSDGQSAVAASAREKFDLILMDVHLPLMSGTEVTRAIRHREMSSGMHTPIIALTAAAMEGDRAECLASGMDDYVSKPLTSNVLSGILRRWLPQQK